MTLTWKNVNAPNASQAGQIMDNGANRISHALQNALQMGEQQRQANINLEDNKKKQATDDALASMFGITDQNQLNQQGQQLLQQEGIDRGRLFDSLVQQQNHIAQQQGKSLSNQLQQKKVDSFDEEHAVGITGQRLANALQSKKVNAFDSNLALDQQGKELANSLQEKKVNAFDGNLALEQEAQRIQNATGQTKLDYLPDTLKAGLKKSQADAQRAVVQAAFEERNQESGLANDRSARAARAAQTSMAQQRLAFDKSKHNANMRMKRNEIYRQTVAAGVDKQNAANQAKLLEAYANNPSPDSAAAYLNSGGKSANLTAIRGAAAKDKFTGSGNNSGVAKAFQGFKLPESYKKVASAGSKDEEAALYMYVDDLNARNGEIALPEDSGGGTGYLTKKGLKHYLNFVAKEVGNSRVHGDASWLPIDVNSASLEDSPKWERNFWNSLSDKQKVEFIAANEPNVKGDK